MSLVGRPDSVAGAISSGDAAPANNEIDDKPVFENQEVDGLKQRLNISNYKLVTGARSSTGKFSFQTVWQVKSLDEARTDALTAGRGVTSVQF
jgi:hypothetical protein